MKNKTAGKALSVLVWIVFFSGILSAQTVYTRYWVAFTDKNNSLYNVSNPQQFLSQRSIDRRTHQNISVNIEDLPVNATYIQQVSNTGALVMSRSKWFNGVIVRLTNQSQLAAITALSCVQSTRPLARVRSAKKTLPVTQTIPNQRTQATQGNIFNYGYSEGQIYLLNGQCLHNKGYNGSGMQIGIIDNGFINAQAAAVFDTLWQNHQILGVHDFFTDDSLVYNEGGHGTYVLSCMAANSPGQMIGTAPYAKFYLLRSEIDSTEKIVEVYQWVSAIEYADSAGADIINSSLGYTLFDDTTQSFTWANLNGRTAVASLSATMAARRGMIACIAAGNEGCGNSSGSSAQCWQKISVPADADSILAVGAVWGLNSTSPNPSPGSYAYFSSTGNTADGRIKPDVVAQGVNVTIANSSGIVYENGTSFASPTMAGMVACLWQGNPKATNMQVIMAVKQSASQYTHPDSLLGYGIPDFCVADNILKQLLGIPVYSANQLTALCGNGNCELTVSMYDVSGRMVLSTQTTPAQNSTTEKIIQSLDLSALAGGMYLMKISSSNGNSLTKKLVKS
jgi:serine protease AprX